MVDVFEYGREVEMITIDMVDVPKSLLEEANKLANETGKLQFIGAVYERNPDFVETAENNWTFQPGRLRTSGEFWIGDDHDEVRNHKPKAGFLGGIIWCSPVHGARCTTGQSPLVKESLTPGTVKKEEGSQA